MVNHDDLAVGLPHGMETVLYTRLKLLYILGFLECLVGAAIIVLESASIGFFYSSTLNYPLEIAGILIGAMVFATGVCDFCGGRDLVVPQTRRKLFIAGIVLSLASLAAVGAILVISVLRSHFLYQDVIDKEGRDESDHYNRRLPYLLSYEGLRHAALLRAIIAGVYSLGVLFLLGTLILNIANLGKNKNNAETATVYSRVPKEEVKILTPNRSRKGTDL
ncbi:hypothetical protein BV898_08262 [Hypsibius exemplaris]|uniref:MARVEL domain-containing protein n=1 Tax=Hypsibius exemplaris TaxID=2072580 RepID=A0A1W0WR02_HYPEX|nr:hypothetical protein BV898_08262 [Hypsibius exemplaris]